MKDRDTFADNIETLESRLSALQQQVLANPTQARELLNAAVVELLTTVEELHVAQEELTQQTDELAAAQVELDRERQRYRDLFQFAPDAYIITNDDGKILEVNRAAQELFIFPENLSVTMILALADMGWHSEIGRLLLDPPAAGEKTVFEAVLKRRTGETFPVEVSMARGVADRDGAPTLQWMIRDITGRKRAQEERIRTARLESIGTLAGGIAHDFNNLLTGILGTISLAKGQTAEDDSRYANLDMAEKAAQRAALLAQQLLTFAKGGAPIRETVTIQNLIHDAAEFALTGNSISAEYLMADDLWPAEVDQGQISQAIANIIINAREAMSTHAYSRPDTKNISVAAENIRITPEDVIRLPEGDYIRITISDSGQGIPEVSRGHIFDPYFTTKDTGSGLGLATAFSIIQRHGGTITFESTEGVGTTFFIYLPAAEHRPVHAAPEPVHEKPVRAGKGRILVMDDEALIRFTVTGILKSLGYSVESTKDGVEAIDVYLKAKESGEAFDVVVMDLIVKDGMGGKEATEKLLELDPQAKVIVSSGYSTDAIMSEFAYYGFRAAVPKPFASARLDSVLEELISENGQ